MLNPIIDNHTHHIKFKKPCVSNCQRLFVESRLSFSYMPENGRAICISLLPSVIYITICLKFVLKNIPRKINIISRLIHELIPISFDSNINKNVITYMQCVRLNVARRYIFTCCCLKF